MATLASAKKERAIAKISKTYQRFSKILLTSRLALQISCMKSHGLFKVADLYWFECFSVAEIALIRRDMTFLKLLTNQTG